MKRSDLLNILLYGLDIAARPTYSNMSRSYESWLRYNHLHPSQLGHLKAGGLVEQSAASNRATWAMRLTERGRLQALGGRDPEELWDRHWDGQWRFLMFDLPSGNERVRRRLYNWLRRNHFGCLQRSVWLTPDAREDVRQVLDGESTGAGAVITVEGRPLGLRGQEDTDFVDSAWSWEEINRRHDEYISFSRSGLPKKPTASAARDWVREERRLWENAVQFDPLLPRSLWPNPYLGSRAWKARQALLKKASPMTIALRAD